MSSASWTAAALAGAMLLASGACSTTGSTAGSTDPAPRTPAPPPAARTAEPAPVGVLAIAPESPPAPLPDLGETRFQLRTRDTALGEVLEILSRAAGREIRAAPGIGGRLSVSWNGLTVIEALDRLTARLGLAAKTVGDAIVLDRPRGATMLVRLPEAAEGRAAWREAIRKAVPAGGHVVVSPRDPQLLLISADRPQLERLRGLIEAGVAGDNGLRGGAPWTTPSGTTPSSTTPSSTVPSGPSTGRNKTEGRVSPST